MNRSMRFYSCLVVGLLFFSSIHPQSLQVSLFGREVFMETVQATQKWLENHKGIILLVGTLGFMIADCYAVKSTSCVTADRKNHNDVNTENRSANVTKRENPITFNGQNINDIIQPGQVLVCESSAGTHILGFEMKNGNIKVESLMFKDSSLVDAEIAYVEECKNQTPQMSGKMINMSAGTSMNLRGSWMTAQDYIALGGRLLLRIEDRLLSCKKIELTGNKMEFDRCFIETDELIIQTKAAESCCQIIHVTFSKDSSVLKGLQGCIDFANNETYSDCNLRFMGVEKIEIQFAPHAF